MTQSTPLRQLAERAGISVEWIDAHGRYQHVGNETLVRVLAALGLPAEDEAAIDTSRALLDAEARDGMLLPLVTCTASRPIRLKTAASTHHVWQITLESGQIINGESLSDAAGELIIPGVRAMGYHQLRLNSLETVLAVAPERCFGVNDALNASVSAGATSHKRGLFGVNLQVYSLRRASPEGIGDFTALAEFCAGAASFGVDAVGVNPLHAGFAADPTRFSPYAPSSRLFLNPLYVDARATFGAFALAGIGDTPAGRTLKELDTHALIDWPETARARMAILRSLFERRSTLMNSQLKADFARFVADGGQALQHHACFEALHTLKFPDTWGWRAWPVDYHAPDTAAVAEFAAAHAEDIEFFCFLQWLARRDLQRAQETAREAGMAIGLIADLAVGADPNGSHAWSHQDQIIRGLTCGAPADIYNAYGQGWGLSAFSPRGLVRSGYRAFLEMLRASLTCAGAVRIDHVLGMARLWLIPDGMSPREGAYLAYPLTDLLRLTALESWRHHAVIIGENLGTVPPGFNPTLEQFGLLGTSVLFFEKSLERVEVTHPDGQQQPVERFLAPAAWPACNMAVTTTHDLPTIAGWWRGHDIEWREQLGLLPPARSLKAEFDDRAMERSALWRALQDVGLVSGLEPGMHEPPINAILQFVAMTPSALVAFPIEDLLALVEQPNLPGTVAEHPNWRRRLPATVAEILARPNLADDASRIRRRRLSGL